MLFVAGGNRGYRGSLQFNSPPSGGYALDALQPPAQAEGGKQCVLAE